MKRRKCAAVDYTEAQLPSTRLAVFQDIVKLQFRQLLKIGLILLLCAIPYLVSVIISDLHAYELYDRFVAQELTGDEYARMLAASDNAYAVLQALSLVVLSFAVAGGFRVVRQLSWAEPVFFAQDYIDGVKMYGKQFLGIFLLLGLLVVGNVYLIGMDADSLMIAFLGCSLFIMIPVLLLSMSQRVVYTNSLLKNMINGLLMYIRTLPATLLAYVLFMSPFAVELVLETAGILQIALVKYILFCAYLLVLLPLSILGWFLYSCYVFDKCINQTQYPDLVDRGVYRKKGE